MNTFDPKIRVYQDTLIRSENFVSLPSTKYNNNNDFKEVSLSKMYNKTKVEVVEGDCLDIAMRYVNKGNNLVVLNMADYDNPGGTVIAGGGAQEEELFRRTNYCKTLTRSFYPIKGVQAIYSPEVYVFKHGENNRYMLMDNPVKMNFIACPAPKGSQNINIQETLDKIRLILNIAYVNNNQIVVLSAWGCGAFSCNPNIIADLFKQVLKEYNGVFKEIIFAIKKGYNYEIFKSVLNQ